MSPRTDKDPSLTQAAVGALADVQGLLKQAAKAMTYDTAGLSRSVTQAAGLLAAAWATMIIGGVLVCLALVYALALLLPVVPLWAWFAVVGLPTLGVGVILCASARQRLASLQPMPGTATETAEEVGQMATHLGESIESAKASISRTVDTVKSTVESIEHAVDLNYQVQQRPWAMLAGAAGLGYVGGAIIHAATDRASHRQHAANGHTPGNASDTEWTSRRDEPGLFDKLGDLIAPQAQLARDIAIGALFGLARDWAREGVSKPLSEPVNDFFDRAAKKFGGDTPPQEKKKASATNGAAGLSRPVA